MNYQVLFGPCLRKFDQKIPIAFDWKCSKQTRTHDINRNIAAHIRVIHAPCIRNKGYAVRLVVSL